MPVNTINGWTSAGLSPSYSILASILHSAGGTPTQAATTAPVVSPTPATSGGNNGQLFGRPVTKPGVPTGYGGGQGGPYYGGGGGMAPAGGRTAIDPSLNPQQAYAQYLQNRALIEGSTPQTSAMNIAYYQHALLNDADPSGLYRNPDVGQIGRPQDSYLEQVKFQSDLANRLFQNASPYSYAQGVAPAYAPPAPPAGGYTAGWNNAGSGFGFGY